MTSLARRWIRSDIGENDTVLDLGCGICNPIHNIKCKRLVGVDIYEGYRAIAEKVVDEFIVADITKMKLRPKSYDVVMLIDVIEHLEHDEAVKIIDKAERWARKKVIIFAPIGFLTQELDSKGLDAWGYPNPAQIHRSGFETDFFIKKGYSVKKYPGDRAHDRHYEAMYCVKEVDR